MNNNIAYSKSKPFAVRIVKLYKHLTTHKNEHIMSKQILRSGTSIGANLSEAKFAQSRADFYTKYKIALKETAETLYWLELLKDTEYISLDQFKSLYSDCNEILSILISATKTLNSN